MRSRTVRNLSASQGFTLVEMLVVAPIVLLVIGVLVSAMVSMVGDAMVANTRTTVAYNTREALNRIEEDARVSMNFMNSFSYFRKPQGKDNNLAAFKSTSSDLILTQQATTKSPYNAIRDLVYYKDQPSPCDSTRANNRALLARVIYFTTNRSDGKKTLWRRVISRDWNTTGDDANTVCDTPWQRNTCADGQPLSTDKPAGAATIEPSSTSPCLARDEKILDNVTGFTTTYYTPGNSVTTNPLDATSFRVKLTSSEVAAGTNITQSATVQVSRISDVPIQPAPVTPVITKYLPDSSVYNNTLKMSFTWKSPGAYAYIVRYRINGGDWSDPETTTSNTKSISVQKRSAVQIAVTGVNDTGTSAEAYSTPEQTNFFTAFDLENSWVCYGSPYACPEFTITDAGVVSLHGSIRDGTSQKIATLPDGFAPSKTLIFEVQGAGNNPARIDVSPNGSVRWVGGASNGWLALNNINFLSANAEVGQPVGYPTFNCPSGCTTPWRDYADGASAHGKTTFILDTLNRVHMSGIILAPTPAPTFGIKIMDIPTSPINFTPANNIHEVVTTSSAGTGFSNMQLDQTAINYRLGSGQGIYLIYASKFSTTSWTTPALLNGGVVSGAYTPMSYSKASDGLVSLRGLATNGTVSPGTVLFKLPVGMRPRNNLVFLTAGYNSAASEGQVSARVDITPDGNVSIQSGNGTLTSHWLSLAGINFVAEQ